MTRKLASSIAQVPTPAQPDFELLAATYPELHRPIYHRAVAMTEMNSPVAFAISACLLLSLIEEDVAFREDARLRAAQMCYWLHLRDLGEQLLRAWPAPRGTFHSEQYAAATAGFATLEQRPLDAWFSGPAQIAQALIPLASDAAAPVLHCGPTSMLCMLYGKYGALFSLKVPDAQQISRRFFGRLPRAVVLAETALDPSQLQALLKSYAELPIDRFIAALPAAAVFDIEGFERSQAEFEIPSGVPHSLGGEAVFGAPIGLPALYSDRGPFLRLAAVAWTRV